MVELPPLSAEDVEEALAKPVVTENDVASVVSAWTKAGTTGGERGGPGPDGQGWLEDVGTIGLTRESGATLRGRRGRL